MNTAAEHIKPGDLVLPPTREINLWMRRSLREKGLSENDLFLKVVDVHEGAPDKRGRWISVKGQYSREWTKDYRDPSRDYYMTFKARPQTQWTIKNGEANQ